MKYLFTIIFSAFLFNGMAQPIITSSNFNSIGEISPTYNYPTTLTSPGISGTNVLWDYSAFSKTSLDNITIASSLGAPYASTYPLASMVWIQPSTGTVGYQYINNSNPNLPLIQGAYTAFTNSSTQFVNISYNSAPIPVRVYPTTLNTSTAGPMNGDYSAFTSSAASGTRKGNYTYVADGYGTLKLDKATFANTIRTKQVQNYRDSINFPNLGISYYTIINANLVTYTWIKQEVKGAVLQLSIYASTTTTFIAGSSFGSTKSITYTSYSNTDASLVTNLQNVANDNSFEFQIFPNPSQVELHLVSNDNSSIDYINIRSLEGTLIKMYSNFGTVANLDVSCLPKGLYLAEIIHSNNKTIRKFSIE